MPGSRPATLLLAGAFLVSGCGTATFDTTVTVVVGGATEAQRVSVFDPQMGSTRDWAQRTAGTTSPSAPYTTVVPAVDTKMIFDSNPPRRVVLGLWLPEVSDAGYFRLAFEPQDGSSVAATGGLVPWQEGAEPDVPPLPVSVAAAATDRGWQLGLTVEGPHG